MRLAVAIVLVTAGLGAAAPVPRKPPPDPFGSGYFGVWPLTDERLDIGKVEPGTPAARAGLRGGDVFVRVGGCVPKSFAEVRGYVIDFRPGTRMRVTVRRGDETVTVTLTLGCRESDADPAGLPRLIDPDPDR